MAETRRTQRKLDQLDVFWKGNSLWRLVQETELASLLEYDEAFSVAHAIQCGDQLIRYELEARILAKQPQTEIAAKMGLPTDVVAEFTDWFFDVKDRLGMTNWILHEAIQLRPSGEWLKSDVGPFLRFVGFQYGLVVLESFLAAASSESLAIKGIDTYWQRDSPLEVDLKLLVLIKRIPVPKTPQEEICWSEFQAELMSLMEMTTEELLSPLTLEMPLGSELELAFMPMEFKSSGTEAECKVIRLLKTILSTKPRPVGQTSAV